MSRTLIYLVRVHRGMTSLTWLRQAASTHEAVEWAHARWPDGLVTACQPLRARRPLATFSAGAQRRRFFTPATP